jgi:hypothetical protein
MANKFRTTVSAVFWTETPEEAESIVDDVNADLPPGAASSTLATIEYRSEGEPPVYTPPALDSDTEGDE